MPTAPLSSATKAAVVLSPPPPPHLPRPKPVPANPLAPPSTTPALGSAVSPKSVAAGARAAGEGEGGGGGEEEEEEEEEE